MARRFEVVLFFNSKWTPDVGSTIDAAGLALQGTTFINVKRVTCTEQHSWANVTGFGHPHHSYLRYYKVEFKAAAPKYTYAATLSSNRPHALVHANEIKSVTMVGTYIPDQGTEFHLQILGEWQPAAT